MSFFFYLLLLTFKDFLSISHIMNDQDITKGIQSMIGFSKFICRVNEVLFRRSIRQLG